jgi:hypothetical protein
MRYRMVSEESKRRFREWLDACPDPTYLSPRRSAGAFDVKEDEPPVCDPRFKNTRVGDLVQSDDGVIEVVADPTDPDEPKPRIPAAARLRRGNGNGQVFPEHKKGFRP